MPAKDITIRVKLHPTNRTQLKVNIAGGILLKDGTDIEHEDSFTEVNGEPLCATITPEGYQIPSILYSHAYDLWDAFIQPYIDNGTFLAGNWQYSYSAIGDSWYDPAYPENGEIYFA